MTESHKLTLPEAVNLAPNQPVWRLLAMHTHGASQKSRWQPMVHSCIACHGALGHMPHPRSLHVYINLAISTYI